MASLSREGDLQILDLSNNLYQRLQVPAQLTPESQLSVSQKRFHTVPDLQMKLTDQPYQNRQFIYRYAR